MIQPEFQLAVDKIAEECRAYFSKRLVAMYINGSVYTGEAIVGESDFDCFLYINNGLNCIDKKRIEEIRLTLTKCFPVFKDIHLNVNSIENLKSDKFTRFVLKYNSVLYFGDDVVESIDASGVDVYVPDKMIAKQRLPFAQKCLNDALKNICPLCMDEMPQNTFLCARKFARYFVLVEGAYFLMSKNKFTSFKQEIIIQELIENSIEFKEVLSVSLAVLLNPIDAKIRHEEFLKRIEPFVNWMFDEIEKA